MDKTVNGMSTKAPVAAAKLRRWIDDRGLDQRRFAEIADISQPTLSRLIRGVTTRPPPEVISKIEHATTGWVTFRDWLLPK